MPDPGGPDLNVLELLPPSQRGFLSGLPAVDRIVVNFPVPIRYFAERAGDTREN